jgi:hypothetical protein
MDHTQLDPADLRTASVAMLGVAAILPLLPGHPGFACPLRLLTGVPCPLCGMTTSVEHTVRLELSDAIASNPVGPLAVLAAVLLLVLRPARISIPAQLVPVGLAALWVFQLHRFDLL